MRPATPSVLHPQLAGPVEVNCTSGPWGGITSTECTNDYVAHAGGGEATAGNESVAGGTVADAPIAMPVTGNHISGAWGGISDAVGTSTLTSEVGGDTYNHGDDSVGGGNIVGTPIAGTADAMCIAGAWGGIPTSTCSNDETVTSGGFVGTSGNDAIAAGNIVDEPVALPVEVFGIAGAWGGIPTSTMEENKVVTAGGDNNTNDDGGVVSSNIVTAPQAVGAQVFKRRVRVGRQPDQPRRLRHRRHRRWCQLRVR